LMARYDALENQCEESDLLEAEMKLMRCIAKVRAWTPEMRAGSGVVVPGVTVMCVSSVVCSCAVRMTWLTTLTARNRCRKKRQWRKSACRC
ncbi:putative chromosome partitioning protein parB, partial [Escherichia coli 2749250]